MTITKEDDAIGSRTIVISRYDDGSFASARERIRSQMYEDGNPIGAPIERWVDITDQATLAALVGAAAASQRAHVERVEVQIQQERDAAAAEVAALRAALDSAQARIAALEAAQPT